MGLLLACFSNCEDHTAYCLVRLLQPMDIFGEPVCNEYDCPILNLSNLIYCIPSTYISHAVSVVHECTTTCSFITNNSIKRIEQENVNVCLISYNHDWSNKMYCLNLYCMH